MESVVVEIANYFRARRLHLYLLLSSTVAKVAARLLLALESP